MRRCGWMVLGALLLLASAAGAQTVGFQDRTLPDGSPVGIWYPSAGAAVRMTLGPYAQVVVADGPLVGGGRPLVDRAGFHRAFNAAVVGFFDRAMPGGPGGR